MAANLNEQEAERMRREMIVQLEKDRAEKAASLAAVDAKLKAVQDSDFTARLGTRKRSEMSIKERAEVVSKVGAHEYLNLDW